jgi:hypothetical protein
MALAATTVWEVRTTGDATNGAGFNASQTSAGTDYSQQDAAQLALTDLACASNTTLTSATGGFTAAMIGNLIYIASGTNDAPGYYEITAYTDTNTVTIDRTCATGGNMTDGVGKVGGATNHPQTIAPSVVAGNTIYVAAGTYQKVGANAFVLNYTVAGTQYLPIRWKGYNSARATRPIGTDRPVFDANSDAADVVLSGNSWNVFDSFILQAGTDKGIDFSSNYSFYGINLKVSNNGGFGISRNNSAGAWVYLFGCEVNNNGSAGVYSSASALYCLYCYVHDNTGIGLYQRYGGNDNYPYTLFINCISESNAGHGFRMGDDGGGPFQNIILNNIAYNNTGANNDGFHLRTSNATGNNWALSFIANNASISNASYGFEGNNTVLSFFDYNSYYGNSTGGLYLITNGAGAHDVTTDPLFTDGAGADFTVGAASPLIGAGMDTSTFTSLTTDFNVNIGIDQSDHVTAGTGGSTWFSGE